MPKTILDRSGTLIRYRVYMRFGSASVRELDVWAESESDARKHVKAHHAGMRISIVKVRGYVNGVLQN